MRLSRTAEVRLLAVGLGLPAAAQESPEQILLKDYRPNSIHKVPRTELQKARYPVIDIHSHAYAKTPEQVAAWVKLMDEVGVERTVILTGAVGAAFDELYQRYSKYPGRFDLWCGLDLRDADKPDFPASAVRELERCHRAGARGVGELVDKGGGIGRSRGLHPDDPRLEAVFRKCAELKMPVNLHVADPIWMYQPMDKTNDGLMNAFKWRLDNRPGIVGHAGMIEILANTVKRNPRTTFIACHFANLDYDLARLGELFGRHSNLYADISARYAETAPIPRFTARFYEKFANRLLYGTDMGYHPRMYRTTFRILETLDEHFYEIEQFGYHWALNGLGLPDAVLRKVYRENARKLVSVK
jgi:predicted TIM-barrel fold metal-dependent hydrolase